MQSLINVCLTYCIKDIVKVISEDHDIAVQFRVDELVEKIEKPSQTVSSG